MLCMCACGIIIFTLNTWPSSSHSQKTQSCCRIYFWDIQVVLKWNTLLMPGVYLPIIVKLAEDGMQHVTFSFSFTYV